MYFKSERYSVSNSVFEWFPVHTDTKCGQMYFRSVEIYVSFLNLMKYVTLEKQISVFLFH